MKLHLGTRAIHLMTLSSVPMAKSPTSVLNETEVVMVAFFAIKWLPQAPKQALVVLTIQIVAALAACVPVYILNL